MAPLCYRRHRFPREIIRYAICLYLRFTLSYRDVEELLAERGLDISAPSPCRTRSLAGWRAGNAPRRAVARRVQVT